MIRHLLHRLWQMRKTCATVAGLIVALSLAIYQAGCGHAANSTVSVAGYPSQVSAPHGGMGYGERARNNLVPPESLPPRDQELWIIQKANAAPATADPATPRSGALMAKLEPNATPDKLLPCPLKHTDVKASVAGYIAAVEVTQQFHNPFAQKIEAVYVFPLPANSAINEFVMTVGDRKIRGIIRERAEAEKLYREARNQGYVASLMTQERPNIFTQSVANIEPGKQIDINIRYFNTLTYSDGWYEFAFPMVVGPRFNPPHMTDGVGAVGVGSRGASGQTTEVSYLKPGERTGHDISLAVDLDAGVAFDEVKSVNHVVQARRVDEQHAAITLDRADSIPNKDFVLRWKVAGDRVKSGLIAATGSGGKEAGGYFTLMVVPPAELRNLPTKPLELVFTLDVSGSMSGRPLEQCKSAMRYALTRMGPDDRFQVVKFASGAEQLASEPLPATPENVRRAMKYVEDTEAGGGTMMLEGMRKSLDFPRDPNRLRVVAFLTDGYIGNETEILAGLHHWLGNARVFSFGVGSSTNRYLMDAMAKMGRGAAAYLTPGDNPDEVMSAWFGRIRHPAMTDLAIDFGGMQASEVFPRQIPDLFVGRPVIVTGKFAGSADARLTLRGRVGQETRAIEIAAQTAASPGIAKALRPLWARSKISDLSEESAYTPGLDAAGRIRAVALEYGLMSAYTAFIAVDSTTRTAGDHGVTVPVPVPIPDGVRYDTTVTEKPKTPPVSPSAER